MAGEFLVENNIVSDGEWLGAGLGKDAVTTIMKAVPAERALSREIVGSVFTAEFWAVLRQSPRLTLQLVRPNGLLKDLGKGFTKGLGVGIPQLIINNIINDEEESIEESNEELVKHLQQQSTVNGDIVANI